MLLLSFVQFNTKQLIVIYISDAGQNYGNSQDTDEGGINFGAGKTETSVCQYSFNLVVVNSIHLSAEVNHSP